MKHLKIVEPGYANFAGTFGTVEFKDGVSVYPVSAVETQRLQALLRIEAVGEEVEEKVAPMFVNLPTSAELAGAGRVHVPEPELGDSVPDGKVWTREELEGVADKRGIKGLREIAAGFGVAGKAIGDLIGAILAKQGE